MLVGIDIGTQSLKAVVTDSTLKILGQAARPYSPVFPHPNWVASNTFAHLSEATALLPPLGECLSPDPLANAQLEDSYARYRKLFAALKPMFLSDV